MALSASNASCADTPIRDAPRRFSFIFLRDGRDWGDHGRKLEGHQDRSWQGNVAGGVMGRDHERWQGGDRGAPGQPGPGHAMHRGGMAGRGGFTQGPNQSHVAPSAAVQGGFAGQERTHRATEPRFARRY